MALMLYNSFFWLVLVLTLLAFYTIARRVQLRWWPAIGTRLLIAGMVIILAFMFLRSSIIISNLPESLRGKPLPIPPRQVLIITEGKDQLSTDIDRNRSQAVAWLKERANRLVVVAGSKPVVIAGALDTSAVSWPSASEEIPDISSAIAQAFALLDDEDVGEVFILKDLYNRNMREKIQVGPLWIPSSLWAGVPFPAKLHMNLPQSMNVTIEIEANGRSLPSRQEELPKGDQDYIFNLETPSDTDAFTLAVHLTWQEGDAFYQTSAYAASKIFPTPNALILSEEAEIANRFADPLRQAGINIEIMAPSEFPTKVDILEKYPVIFLHNIMVSSFNSEQLKTLEVLVKKFGKGLVFLGGRQSYTLGDMKNSILEPMLPVILEPPHREQREPVYILLVIDVSASMGIGNITEQPIALARESAMRVVETLNPQDTLGILTYSDEPFWALPISNIGEGLVFRRAIDSISGIRSIQGTEMYAALKEALIGLDASPADIKRNALVLSDGKSADGSPELFKWMAHQFEKREVSLTTIALGRDSDKETMENLATWGKGQYYLVENVDDLPKVIMQETRAAQGEHVQIGETSLVATQIDHPILSGLAISELPPLQGYNALRSRSEDGAVDVFVSASFDDPLLSVWQVGLGRVACWMGDAGEEWATPWLEADKTGLFWAQVMRYVLPDPSLQTSWVNAEIGVKDILISTYLADPSGVPINMQQVTFAFEQQGEIKHKFLAQQIAPGTYQSDIPRLSEGAYMVRVLYESDSDEELSQTGELILPLAINLADKSNWTKVQIPENIQQLTWDELFKEEQDETLVESPDQPEISEQRLWFIALLIAWVLEIGIRRRWLPWK
jgi:uncharacterized membrane protein